MKFLLVFILLIIVSSQSTSDIEINDINIDYNSNIRIYTNKEIEIQELKNKLDKNKYEKDLLNQQIVQLSDELSNVLLEKDILTIKLYDIDIKYQELNSSYLELNQQYISKDYEFNQSSLDLNIIKDELYLKEMKINEIKHTYDDNIINLNITYNDHINYLTIENNNLLHELDEIKEKSNDKDKLINELTVNYTNIMKENNRNKNESDDYKKNILNNDNLIKEVDKLNDELSEVLIEKDILAIKLYDIDIKYQELNNSYLKLNQQYQISQNESSQIILDSTILTQKFDDAHLKLNDMINKYDITMNENKKLLNSIELFEKQINKNNIVQQEKSKENSKLLFELNKSKDNYLKLQSEYDILINFSRNNKNKIDENTMIINMLENNHTLCLQKVTMNEKIIEQYLEKEKTNFLIIVWNKMMKFLCKLKKTKSCELQLLNG
jgi:hypothetical protein